MKFIFAALSATLVSVSANSVARNLNNEGFGATTTGTFECLLLEEHKLDLPDAAGNMPPHEEEPWYCETEDGQLYEINRPAAWFKARGVVSGETIMTITNADRVNGGFNFKPQMKINGNSQVEMQFGGGRRNLAPRSGVNTMLIIRGISGDGAPTKSRRDIAVDVFGDLVGGVDPVNLASQYDACSNGQLKFAPATGPTIVDGSVEITITDNIAGMNRITAHNLFTSKASSELGSLSQWTQTFIVMQGDVDYQGAAAYAYINSYLSVYNNNYATQVVVQMHEIGHNLGLYHSGEVATYDDHTCMMGNPAYADDATIQCFNGAKSWFLGWYSAFHASITPTSMSWAGLMVGVDDFATESANSNIHTVVAKIDDTSSTEDYYVMYNRAKGVNSGVKEYGNTVTVVRAANGSTSGQSYIVAHLTPGQTYNLDNFSGSSSTLIIEVCAFAAGTPDTASVLVYLDGVNNLSCDGNPPPTNPPVATPTNPPTPAPTTPPTPAPTNPPVAPTNPPISAPTNPPVPAPTNPPVPAPTNAPVCPICGNGDECCVGVCSLSGKPTSRGCISGGGTCPVCENGATCCPEDGVCVTGGPKSGRVCSANTNIPILGSKPNENASEDIAEDMSAAGTFRLSFVVAVAIAAVLA